MRRLSALLLLGLVAQLELVAASPDLRIVGHSGRCSVLPHTHWAVTVKGRVTGIEGKPVPGAMVWVGYFTLSGKARRPLAQGRTDARGRFAIPCTVTVFHSGTRYRFEELEVLALAEDRGLGVQGFHFRRADGLHIELQPIARLEGTVRACDGRPIAGAQVQVSSVTGLGPEAVLTWVLGRPAVTHSDESGRFQIALVPQGGEGRLRVSKAGMSEASLAVPSGGTVTVTLHDAGVIEGRVVEASRGRPIAATRVRLVNCMSANLHAEETRTDATGRFRFEGVTGSYWLGLPDLPLLPLEVAAGWCQIRRLADLRVPAGAVVDGKVQGKPDSATGFVIPRALRATLPPTVRVSTRLRGPVASHPDLPASPARFVSELRWTHHTPLAPDGSFLLRLPAGEWELVATALDSRTRRMATATAHVQVKEGEHIAVMLRLKMSRTGR